MTGTDALALTPAGLACRRYAEALAAPPVENGAQHRLEPAATRERFDGT